MDYPHKPKKVSKPIVVDMKEIVGASLWALGKLDVTLNVECWITGIGATENVIPDPNGLKDKKLPVYPGSHRGDR